MHKQRFITNDIDYKKATTSFWLDAIIAAAERKVGI